MKLKEIQEELGGKPGQGLPHSHKASCQFSNSMPATLGKPQSIEIKAGFLNSFPKIMHKMSFVVRDNQKL